MSNAREKQIQNSEKQNSKKDLKYYLKKINVNILSLYNYSMASVNLNVIVDSKELVSCKNNSCDYHA